MGKIQLKNEEKVPVNDSEYDAITESLKEMAGESNKILRTPCGRSDFCHEKHRKHVFPD